jgi:hypothetical protein
LHLAAEWANQLPGLLMIPASSGPGIAPSTTPGTAQGTVLRPLLST